MKQIQNQTFDEERALYGSKGILVKDCTFDGPADGESAFKESSDIEGLIVIRYYLALRGAENGVTVMVTPFFCVQG